MKRKVTKKQVHDVYAIVSTARLNGLKKNEDKTAVLKVMRELRPVAVRYEEDIKEAVEKLKPEGYDEQLRLARQYERESRDGAKSSAMTLAEYNSFCTATEDYNRAVADAMQSEDKATVELDFEPLAAPLVEELMDVNGWTVGQYFTVEELVGASLVKGEE